MNMLLVQALATKPRSMFITELGIRAAWDQWEKSGHSPWDPTSVIRMITRWTEELISTLPGSRMRDEEQKIILATVVSLFHDAKSGKKTADEFIASVFVHVATRGIHPQWSH